MSETHSSRGDLARQFLADGSPGHAIAILEKGINSPGNAILLAALYRQSGGLSNADEVLEIALRESPASVAVINALASATLGRSTTTNLASEIIYDFLDCAQALFLAQSVYARAMDIKDFDLHFMTTHVLVAQLYRKITERHKEIDKESDYPFLLNITAELTRSFEYFPLANRLLVESLKANPENPNTYSMIGKIAAQQEDFATAHTAYETAATFAPNHPKIRQRLAELPAPSGTGG